MSPSEKEEMLDALYSIKLDVYEMMDALATIGLYERTMILPARRIIVNVTDMEDEITGARWRREAAAAADRRAESNHPWPKT
jgi:hypothetical protein